MANTTEKITVDELSKFGFKVGNEYINYSKKISDSDKAKVVPGATLDAELYVAESGKRYLNKVLGNALPSVKLAAAVLDTAALPKIIPVDTERAKRFVPKFNKVDDADKMSKADWSAKDRSQLVGGRSHDAAVLVQTALTVGVPVAEALKMYKEALQGILSIADEVK